MSFQAINGIHLRNIACSKQLVQNSQNVLALIRPLATTSVLPINGVSTAATTITSIDKRQYSTKSAWKHRVLKTLGLADDSKNVRKYQNNATNQTILLIN